MSEATPAARRKARRFTLQALYQWQLAGASVTDIEAQFLANNDFAKADRGYFHDLLHGVPGQVKELDELLTPFLDRRVEELSQVEKAILRIGAFELKERQDVPTGWSSTKGSSLPRYLVRKSPSNMSTVCSTSWRASCAMRKPPSATPATNKRCREFPAHLCSAG